MPAFDRYRLKASRLKQCNGPESVLLIARDVRDDGRADCVAEALFSGFSLERQVPGDHLSRSRYRFVNMSGVRTLVEPNYSAIRRPSIVPELLIRMLLVGYCFGIGSERRLCDEVHLNLA